MKLFSKITRTAGAIGVGAALTMAAAAGPVAAQERVTIGTGSTGGVYYPLGGGMAEIFTDLVDGVTATAEVTGASIENSRRVGSGEMTLGIGNANTVYFATQGTESFQQEYPLQALAALYPSTFQLVVRADSDIDEVSDLEGARVAVGPPGGATRVMADIVFKAHDIADSLQYEFIDFTEATDSLKDRNIDASVVLAGLPTPTVIDLATTAGIRIVPLDAEAMASINEEHPYYVQGTVAGGTYDGQDEDVATLNIWNILFANADADQDMIYKMTKAIFENQDRLVSIHPAAKKIQPETAVDTPIELAPGAARYFEEVGAIE